MKKNKLYVLCDKNLDLIYGAIQGGHAIAQWLIEHGQSKWSNEYLIYLSVDINKWKQLLDIYGIIYSEFHEPDLDNQLTSIAILEKDLNAILNKKIRKEKLLKQFLFSSIITNFFIYIISIYIRYILHELVNYTKYRILMINKFF